MQHRRSNPLLNIFTLLALVLALIGSAVTVTPAHAAGITVDTTDDELNADGDCSLREAIQAANTDAAVDACTAGSGADVITLPAGTYTLTLPPTGTGVEYSNQDGDLDIMANLTILGAGADTTIIQAGTLGYPDAGANGIDGVFQISNILYGAPALNVTITGVTIANGRNTLSGSGGAIAMLGESHLTLANVVVSGNDATGIGGAIFAFGGAINIDHSTFSNNRSLYGGALYIQSRNTTAFLTITDSSFVSNLATDINGGGALAISGIAEITNSTFANNRAPVHSGGGIFYNGSSLTLRNNTFSGNSAKWGGALHVEGTAHLYNNIFANSVSVDDPNVSIPDCHNYGSIDGSNNLIEYDYPSSTYACGTGTTNLITGQDPQLQPLSGTAPYVLPLVVTSPAVEAGSNAICAAAPVSNLDQPGTTRPQGPDCDLGSYELILTPGYSIIESNGSTDVIEGGATDTYTIMLNSPPTVDVVITPNPDADVTVSPPSLTFTNTNWHTPQIVTVSGVADGIAEDPDSGTITHSVTTTDPDYDAPLPPPANVTVNITEVSLSLSSTSLDFGNQRVNLASPPLYVTLTNNGTAVLVIGTLSITGDFTISDNNCDGQSLDPGGTCNFSVTFTPTTTGAKTGKVTIPSNAPTSPNQVDLSGVGVVPAVGLSASSLDFGDQLVFTWSAAQTVTVTNTGLADLHIVSISNTGNFWVLPWADNCSNKTIIPTGTCTFEVIFSPNSVGAQTGTVSIPSDAASSPDTVSLSGNGIAPELTLSTGSLDFGNQLVNLTSAAQTVTISNTGGEDLHIGVLTITGEFALSSNLCDNATLVPAGTCTFDVTFTPLSVGAKVGEVSIPSDSGGGQAGDKAYPYFPHTDTVSLSGNGVLAQNTLIFSSIGGYDGTVRESMKDSKVGGFNEPISALISVGDDYLNRQYVGILHFDTSGIPDNAVITSVKIRVKGMILSNTTYARLGELSADIMNPYFGTSGGLENQDFQAPALVKDIGIFTHAPTFYKWITLNMNAKSLFALNKTGSTQFRLHFQKKYYNDNIKQQVRFLSGDFWGVNDWPKLIVTFYVP